MAGHRSMTTAIFGVKLEITIIMCVSITNMENPACVAARQLSGSPWRSGVLISVQDARNSHRSKESWCALQRTTREVGEGHIHCSRYPDWLASLERQVERNKSSGIARGLLTERLISILEMDDCAGSRPTDAGDIFGQPCVNSNGGVGSGSIV